MTPTIYRFTFKKDVDLDEVEGSILLAIFAAEGVHGRALVRLDASYLFDEERRVLVVDARTRVGATVARILAAFLTREFGDDAYAVQRVRPKDRSPRSAERAVHGVRR
jgi:hypothetical protein